MKTLNKEKMENQTTWQQKTEMIELLLAELKELEWHIKYHENKLSEYSLKKNIAEYAIKKLTEEEYAKL